MGSDKMHTNIRRFRESNGYSQTSMADELGIGRTTYINFETGKTRLFCKTLEKLARYFGVTEEDILTGKPEEDDLLQASLIDEKKLIIQEYENRIAALNEKLDAAEKIIAANERTIRTLTDTNNFLFSQLHKND